MRITVVLPSILKTTQMFFEQGNLSTYLVLYFQREKPETKVLDMIDWISCKILRSTGETGCGELWMTSPRDWTIMHSSLHGIGSWRENTSPSHSRILDMSCSPIVSGRLRIRIVGMQSAFRGNFYRRWYISVKCCTLMTRVAYGVCSRCSRSKPARLC